MLRTAGRIVVVGTLASVSLAVSVVPSAAQATAQISGTVTDASGAVLPGVTVTATQTDTGFTRTTVTNETDCMCWRACRSVRTSWKRPYRVFARLCRPESSCKSTAARSQRHACQSGR